MIAQGPTALTLCDSVQLMGQAFYSDLADEKTGIQEPRKASQKWILI